MPTAPHSISNPPKARIISKPPGKPFVSFNFEGAFDDFVRRTDWATPVVLLLLTACGIAAIYATGADRFPAFFGTEKPPQPASLGFMQLKFAVFGLVCYAVVSVLEPALLRRCAWPLYWAGILSLVPIAICAKLGILESFIPNRFGAHRWYALPGINVQPSEFVKITTLILLAHIVGKRDFPIEQLTPVEQKYVVRPVLWFMRLKPLRRLMQPLVRWTPMLARVTILVAIPFALIFLQPDLGSALTYVPMMFALLFVAGIPLRFFAFVALAALPFVGALTVDLTQYGQALKAEQTAAEARGVNVLRDPSEMVNKNFKGLLLLENYQRSRLMTMIAPDLIDPLGIGKSWQPRQARLAVANGGVEGLGFKQGELVRKGWLPEAAAHNDFIFSCIAEEWGLRGATGILALFAALVALTLRNAARSVDGFGLCICTGVAALTIGHVFQNIGMNVGLMPVTGVSLPFLSYGGSFILSCFLLFGLVQSVHRSSRPLRLETTDETNYQSGLQRSRGVPSLTKL
jgi:rod shape determining protein RodA